MFYTTEKGYLHPSLYTNQNYTIHSALILQCATIGLFNHLVNVDFEFVEDEMGSYLVTIVPKLHAFKRCVEELLPRNATV